LKAAKKQWAGAMLSIMLLGCVKTIVKESRNFELTCHEEEERKRKKTILAIFWFGTFAMFFCATS